MLKIEISHSFGLRAMGKNIVQHKQKKPLAKGKAKTKPFARQGWGCAAPPLRKGNTNATPLAKGKAKAKAKSKGSPLKKGKGDKKDKNALNKDNLEKLGEMPLKDKIAKASEEESEEQGALVLQESLSAPEKSRAWSKHQTHLWKKGNEEELAEFQAASKKEKGQLTCLFLMRQNAGHYCNVSKTVKATNKLEKKEKWMSEKKAYDEFGDDLDKHVASGRVVWREALGTPDTWEYMDTMDFTKKSIGSSSKEWSMGQEFELEEDEMEAWDKQLSKELHSLMMDASSTPGKGSTSGKRALGKGKGKNKGRGKGKQEEEKDDEEKEKSLEEKIKDGMKKLRKSRDLLTSTMSNYEEALDKVKKKQYLSKTALKEKEEQLVLLENTLGKVKKHLGKGEGPCADANLKAIQDVLKIAVQAMSEAKEEAKELVQITMKTTSNKSSRTS